MLKKSLLLTSTLMLVGSPAYAQTYSDEIIVTATKRVTTLQETPVAVTVTTADVIEKARILDLNDLQSVVPTLRVSQLQNSANTSLSIRGFANGTNNIGLEPSVALFIDGVYRSRAASQIGDLPVLERIEVLSGPQSTLFGKNASAGVVSISSAKPQYETQGHVEVGYGNFNQVTAEGYITTGLSDTLAVSLGGGFQSRDGYGEIVNLGEDINDVRNINIRTQALYEPTEEFSLRLIADYSELDENCCITATEVFGPTAAVVGAIGGQLSSTEDSFTLETFLNSNTPNSFEDWGVSAQADYDLGPATVTSITAYRGNNGGFDESDSDFSSSDILGNVSQQVGIDTFTQELRLTSNTSDSRFDWMLGGFYFNETIDQESSATYGEDTIAFVNFALAGATAGTALAGTTLTSIENAVGNDLGSSYAAGQGSFEQFSQDNESYSIFGTVDFHVTDKLTLSGGLNYTKDTKDVELFAEVTDQFSALNFRGADGAAVLTPLATAGVVANVFANGQDPLPIPGVENGIPTATGFATGVLGLTGTDEQIAAQVAQLQAGTFASAAAQAGFDQYVAGVNQFAAAAGPSQALDLAQAGTLDDISAIQFFTPFVNLPNDVEAGRTSDDDLTWTIKGAYEVNDNVNVYASASTGFKASSFNLTRNSRPFASDLAGLTTAGLQTTNPTTGTRFAGPEETTAYEIGLKSRFEKGAFNIAAFDQTIEGFQTTVFEGVGFILLNAGEQSVRGFEFDSTFNPIEALTLTFAGAYLDAEYDEFLNATVVPGGVLDVASGGDTTDGSADLSGERPAGIPEFAFSVGGTYSFDLTDKMSGYVRADFQYEDETNIVDNLPVDVTREVKVLNAAGGLDFGNGASMQLWVRNITNDEYFNSGFPTPAQTGTFNYYPNQPRTYGAVLRYEF